MEFGAREVADEALKILLAAPEMASATELAWESATELELEPVMESEKALEIAQSNRWVLSSPPWVSFAMADLLTWLGIVLQEVLAARASPEEELLLAAKAQKRDPELGPFASFSCGSKEMNNLREWGALILKPFSQLK